MVASDENQDEEKKFGKFRSILFPIYKHEIPSLLPLFTNFFLIAFIYSLLRPAKLSLTLATKGSGAEVVPFLKIGAVLPTALFLVFLIARLSKTFSREQVFYYMISMFLSFFAIFIFFLYPNREALELNMLADNILKVVPTGWRGLADMIRYWPISCFYVISELWATFILTTLFWGFVNEVTTITQAARYYALFSFSANFSGIFAGILSDRITKSEYNESLSFLGPDCWSQQLTIIMSIILILGLVVIALFYKINRNYDKYKLSINSEYCIEKAKKEEIEKNKYEYKLSLWECLAYVLKFRYLTCIAVIVISYAVINNLNEVLWAKYVKASFDSQGSDMNSYFAQTTAIIGIFSAIIDLFLTGNIIRTLGWGVAALATPLVAAITGFFFYISILADAYNFTDLLYIYLGNPSISFLILYGSMAVCSTRSLKYTLFDASKEIAYLPISTEAQRKGKAAIDGVCSRFGKSGGSLIYLTLFSILGSLQASVPYVIAIICVLIVAWIYTVLLLNEQISKTDLVKLTQKGRESLSDNENLMNNN